MTLCLRILVSALALPMVAAAEDAPRAAGGAHTAGRTGDAAICDDRADLLDFPLRHDAGAHGVTALDVTSFTLRDGTAACRITAVSGSKISMYEAREAAEVS